MITTGNVEYNNDILPLNRTMPDKNSDKFIIEIRLKSGKFNGDCDFYIDRLKDDILNAFYDGYEIWVHYCYQAYKNVDGYYCCDAISLGMKEITLFFPWCYITLGDVTNSITLG